MSKAVANTWKEMQNLIGILAGGHRRQHIAALHSTNVAESAIS